MIVDHYRILKPKRISPEAPVIIYYPSESEWMPGGAGNVASNLMALGVGRVGLAVVVGEDWDQVNPYRFCAQPGLRIVKDEGRITTVKERLITNRQQICRVDIQSDKDISHAAAVAYMRIVEPLVQDCDVVICSDYAHGAMIPMVVKSIIQLSAFHKKPVVVDSKSKHLTMYRGATIALPNNVEAEVMTGLAGRPRDVVAGYLIDTMSLSAIGMTLGAEGIMLIEKTAEGTTRPIIIPSVDPTEQVLDVTGAGDTVTAAVAVGLGLGMTYHQSLKLANLAAGVVVQKRGVATATLEEINRAVATYGPDWEV